MWIKTQFGGLVDLSKFTSVQVNQLNGQKTDQWFVTAFSEGKNYEVIYKGAKPECEKIIQGIEIGLAGNSKKVDVLAILGALKP